VLRGRFRSSGSFRKTFSFALPHLALEPLVSCEHFSHDQDDTGIDRDGTSPNDAVHKAILA
jgi:hypothetical protein